MKKIVPLLIVSILLVAGGAYALTQNDSAQDEKTSSSSVNDSAPTTTSPTSPNAPAPESTPAPSPTTSPETPKTTYSLAEISVHNKQSDCWTTINGGVYDITSYVPRHPGGVSEIIKICGKDGTALFEGNPDHNSSAKNQLESLKIGTLI